MRRSGLIVFILLFSMTSVFGQLLVGGKLGAHVGQVQFESESFKNQYDPGYNFGGNIGAAITFPVQQPFSLHAELLFASKGKTITIPGESLKNSAQYYYLEMPLMMRMEIWPEKMMYLGIGPNLSYWLGGSGKIDDLESSASSNSYRIHFGDDGKDTDLQVTNPNRLQLGLVFGLGKLFKLQKDRRLSLEARYEMGHSFLGTEDGAYLESLDFSDNLASKHRLLSLNLGYYWVFHKKSKRNKSRTYKAKKRDN